MVVHISRKRQNILLPESPSHWQSITVLSVKRNLKKNGWRQENPLILVVLLPLTHMNRPRSSFEKIAKQMIIIDGKLMNTQHSC
jgi:hypothetical protein